MHPSGPDGKPRLKFPPGWLKTIVKGMCMGAADIVPGISGGTIAFIMGFYDDLLRSISSFNLKALADLCRLRIKSFFDQVGWEFLTALFIGIAISFITLASYFDYILGHEVYRIYLYAAFFGLIVASIYFCAKQMDEWKPLYIVGFFVGAVIAFFLTDTQLKPINTEPKFEVQVESRWEHHQKPLVNYDYERQMLLNVAQTTLSAMVAKGSITPNTTAIAQASQTPGRVGDFADHTYKPGLEMWLVMCGAIGIMAMLLPGISGSYMLTILGVYALAIGALTDFINGLKSGQFLTDDFYILASLAIGIVVGALLFSRVVHWMIRHYRSLTIATMIGFMVGALRSVWPFYSYEYELNPLKLEKGPILIALDPILPKWNSEVVLYAAGFALLGFFLVIVIEWVAHRKHKLKKSN